MYKTAFLNGFLKEEVYMSHPDGLEKLNINEENKGLKLKKAIYGLKQSSRVWNQKVNELC